MKLIDAAERVIALAGAVREYWDAELPKRHRDYPIVHPGEDSGPPPPEQDQLKQFLGELPPETVYQLLLLMHLGRGDFGTANLAEHWEQVQRRFPTPEFAASFMMFKTMLADYLSQGLEKLRRDGINPNRLVTKPARPRK